MRLILIRHGQAEEAAADQTDFHRALTMAGKERLENAYPSLARYLNAKNHCEVWTSPKTRALQTAEVLCRYMPDTAPQVQPFLEEGDFQAFCKAIASHDHGETIVVIGHEPYLSDWVREMTGLDVHLKKGCGEMLYLPPAQPEQAIRINGINFDHMKNLDLFSVPLGVSISSLIEDQHHRIIKARDTFLADPDDSEALSQLRVALRSQYALLQFIEPYCKIKPFHKAERLYLSLYDDLEEMRGINAILKTIHNSRKLELFPLADAMVIEQNSAVMTLCDHLSREDSEEDYNEALHQTIAALMTATETAPLEQLAREQFASRYHLVEKAVLDTDFTDLQAIERLRALCKTSRYLFEFFSPLANYPLAKQYLRIRRLNQRLSVYCDTFYNVDQLQEMLGEDDSPAISRGMRIYTQMMRQDGQAQMNIVNRLVTEMKVESTLSKPEQKEEKKHTKDKDKGKKKNKEKAKKNSDNKKEKKKHKKKDK